MAVECIDSSMYVSKILSDRRKAKKPLMEKMRRARINDSLNELKNLVLDLLQKDASRYSKMEKADVLDMTVTFLRAIQRKEMRTQDPKSMADYRAGFNRCANEVSRNVLANEANSQLREKLLNHLASCCHGNATNRVATSHAPGVPAMSPSFPAISPSAVWVPYPSPPPSPQSKSTVFIPVSPVRPEISPIPSPVGPSTSVAHVPRFNLSPVNSPNSTTKAPLWRPW
ncbi:transcription factor HES-2-like [Montipora capricornis]|uniref:transcription factor HES-2-like n=1 Tax=Montipora capricornis TaxID=246305 RepID=UPI0035F1E223